MQIVYFGVNLTSWRKFYWDPAKIPYARERKPLRPKSCWNLNKILAMIAPGSCEEPDPHFVRGNFHCCQSQFPKQTSEVQAKTMTKC